VRGSEVASQLLLQRLLRVLDQLVEIRVRAVAAARRKLPAIGRGDDNKGERVAADLEFEENAAFVAESSQFTSA